MLNHPTYKIEHFICNKFIHQIVFTDFICAMDYFNSLTTGNVYLYQNDCIIRDKYYPSLNITA